MNTKYFSFYPEFYQKMTDDNLLVAYCGEVSSELVKAILKIIKERNAPEDDRLLAKKRLFAVIVECLQNVLRYSKNINNKRPYLFLLRKEENQYRVITGNFVPNENVPFIKSHLDKLNSMTSTELKQEYRRILLHSHAEDLGGGLGLIEVSLRSGNQIEYELIAAGEDRTFIILKAALDI